MKHHPAAELFPRMSDERFAELVESMRTSGYDESQPVVLFNGQILDGRHRFDAAQKAGVEPAFRTEHGDPWRAVWRWNAVRRDLSPVQRAAAAIKVQRESGELAERKAEMKARRVENGKSRHQNQEKTAGSKSGGQLREEIATEIGVNTGSVQVALNAAKEADAGNPEILNALVSGQLSERDAREMMGGKARAPTKIKAAATEKTKTLVEQIRKLDEESPYAPDDAKASKLGITGTYYSNLRRNYITGRKAATSEPLQRFVDAIEDLAAVIPSYGDQYARNKESSSHEVRVAFKNSVNTLFSNVKKLKDQIK